MHPPKQNEMPEHQRAPLERADCRQMIRFSWL